MQECYDEKRMGQKSDSVYAVMIYDIVDNKNRTRFAKYLQGYGIRVQKSAFEFRITEEKYRKLLSHVEEYISEEDSVRVYRIYGNTQIRTWGINVVCEQEEVVIL